MSYHEPIFYLLMQKNGGSMFSTIASVLFVPSASVLNAVNAVKKANFNSGPVVGEWSHRSICVFVSR
jgi:hypothetical protein